MVKLTGSAGKSPNITLAKARYKYKRKLQNIHTWEIVRCSDTYIVAVFDLRRSKTDFSSDLKMIIQNSESESDHMVPKKICSWCHLRCRGILVKLVTRQILVGENENPWSIVRRYTYVWHGVTFNFINTVLGRLKFFSFLWYQRN